MFLILSGIVCWTLLEYTLHRWVFHLNIKNQNRFMCTFHFMLHGLHHKVPFDPLRLVFPPVPATILTTILYQPIAILHNNPGLILAGGLIGNHFDNYFFRLTKQFRVYLIQCWITLCWFARLLDIRHDTLLHSLR